MIEFGIMALVYVAATWIAYDMGYKDGLDEGISAASEVDTKRTLH